MQAFSQLTIYYPHMDPYSGPKLFLVPRTRAPSRPGWRLILRAASFFVMCLSFTSKFRSRLLEVIIVNRKAPREEWLMKES